MSLTKARVRGFQSFSDSGEVEFLDGINLVIGQNNSGKSALLRALLPTLPDDRHRSPEKWETFRLGPPQIDFTITASGSEMRDWTLRFGSHLHIPVASPPDQNAVAFLDEFFRTPTVALRVTRTPDTGFNAPYPSHRNFDYAPGVQQFNATVVPANGDITVTIESNGNDTLPSLLWNAWNQDMFYFAAERLTVGESGTGHAVRLHPNAANLPNVLHTLSSERGNDFQILLRHLREIFPTVGNVSVRTKPDGAVLEIRVWPTIDMERVELSFPLNFGGTGVAQVISLLTAIIMLYF